MNLQVSEPSLMDVQESKNNMPGMNWMLNGIKPAPVREQHKVNLQTERPQQCNR